MKETTTVDELAKSAEGRLPEWSPEEQRAGLVLLEELAHGGPVNQHGLAEALGTTVVEASALLWESGLSQFVYADESGSALGFWGLSTVPTQHRFDLDGRKLWAWCAIDTLFLPELLGQTARIESKDPESGQQVRLTVSPTGIKNAEPEGVMVSINSPDAWELASAAKLIASACHFIFFFASQESGERWVGEHPRTVLLSLDDAFTVGHLQNERLFGKALARRSS